MSLDFIYSQKYRKNAEDILYSFHASHPARCWLTGFLYNACKLSAKDILRLYEKESNWGDFKEDETIKQVSQICNEHISSFSEDLSFSCSPSNNKEYKKDNTCYDRSIFSKLNKAFFDGALITAYEYSLDKYNLRGKLQWNVLNYPVYRSIECKNKKMLYIDLDCKDIEYGWTIAKDIFSIDNWSFFKFSGSRGFHLCKFIKDISKEEMYNILSDIYQSIKSNLVSFEYETKDSNTKIVNIDPSSVNKNRLIRGFCVNLKSKGYSFPVNVDMKIEEILEISKDLSKIKELLK